MVPGMGWMMMSGVRGSLAGLPNWAARADPYSNVWMRAGLPFEMLACRAATPLAVSAAWVAGFIQINATSSSVTMAGKTPALLSTVTSAWPISASLEGSIGDCPCLAVMMILVVASTPLVRSWLTIDPIAWSTKWIAPFNCGVKMGRAEVLPGSYPPGTYFGSHLGPGLRTHDRIGSTSFCPTLTAWKFMPKMFGTGAARVAVELRPSIWLRMASTLIWS